MNEVMSAVLAATFVAKSVAAKLLPKILPYLLTIKAISSVTILYFTSKVLTTNFVTNVAKEFGNIV